MTNTTLYHRLEESLNTAIKLFIDYILTSFFCELATKLSSVHEKWEIKPKVLGKGGKHSTNKTSPPDLLSNLT